MNYEEAQRCWRGSAKKFKEPKFPGRYLSKNDYLRYNPATGLYEIWHVWQKPRGEARKDVSKWEVYRTAEIGAGVTRLDFEQPGSARSIAHIFRIRRYKLRTIKLGGFAYSCYNHKLALYQSVESSASIELNHNGDMVALAPPTKRVFHKDAQKELNDKIRWARRWLKLRENLGAFQNIDMVALDAEYKKKYKQGVYYPSGAELMKMLNAIDPENIETFNEVIWLSYRGSQYWQRNTGKTFLKYFNSYIARHRETLRQQNGVVSYEQQ